MRSCIICGGATIRNYIYCLDHKKSRYYAESNKPILPRLSRSKGRTRISRTHNAELYLCPECESDHTRTSIRQSKCLDCGIYFEPEEFEDKIKRELKRKKRV